MDLVALAGGQGVVGGAIGRCRARSPRTCRGRPAYEPPATASTWGWGTPAAVSKSCTAAGSVSESHGLYAHARFRSGRIVLMASQHTLSAARKSVDRTSSPRTGRRGDEAPQPLRSRGHVQEERAKHDRHRFEAAVRERHRFDIATAVSTTPVSRPARRWRGPRRAGCRSDRPRARCRWGRPVRRLGRNRDPLGGGWAGGGVEHFDAAWGATGSACHGDDDVAVAVPVRAVRRPCRGSGSGAPVRCYAVGENQTLTPGDAWA